MIFKKKETKEFMRYEDGKIVSIEVEQKNKQKPIEQYQQEIKPDIRFVEKTKAQAKEFFTLKRVKNIALVIILILFVFALYDVYKVFFVTTSDSKPPVNTGVTTQPDTNDPSSMKPDSTPTPTEKPKDPPNESVTETNNSVVALLEVANQVTASMVQLSSNEITNVDNYHKKQVNKIALSNNLKKSLKEKESLYVTFSSYKSLFAQVSMTELFVATENRLVQSIAFTKEIDTILSTDTGSTYLSLQEYPEEDDKLIQIQQDKLINVLKANNISYSINEQLNQVEYEIK